MSSMVKRPVIVEAPPRPPSRSSALGVCPRCVGGMHRQCFGQTRSPDGTVRACGCMANRCHGFGEPLSDSHGGDWHVCAPGCWGWD